jgi:hypothetical protein
LFDPKGVTLATKTQMSDAMQEQLDVQGAKGWKPNEGDTIIGAVVAVTVSNPGEFGIYPIITLATDNGMVNVHAFHNVLKNRFLEKRPAKGERVAIQYQGERTPKNPRRPGQTYHAYSVVVDRDEPDTMGWDAFQDSEPTDDSAE